MINRSKACLTLLVFVCLMCGCWDRKELNDQLFDLAGGIDLDESNGNRYLITGQLFVPKSGEGQDPPRSASFLESSRGKNIADAIDNMQQYLSRSMTRGHRRNLFIGEKLARSGISELLDSYTRDPNSRLRTDIWVVKEGTAQDIMKINYPLEKLSAMAPIKIHQAAGGEVGTSLVHYLMASKGEGSSPTLPVVKKFSSPGLDKPTIMFYGRAIFNHKHKLLGYLNYDEAHNRGWIMGTIKNALITTDYQGTVTGFVSQPKSRIYSAVSNSGYVKVEITIKGKIVLKENNSSLVLSEGTDLMKLQQSFNNEIKTQMLNLIHKVQKEYKADVLGIGEAVYRQHPSYWKNHRGKWDNIFVHSEIIIRPKLEIKQIGQQNSPLHVK
ncbi:Ger(x)C family spore germination protein [Paenibacillus glycanilyticus]|uniref:Ger(x)C family spore germination protein n=1 Tax=Paenibacillus glycanilyticus TaxID=126569 RepID=UPI002041A61C|nr:Ger(x)C family spore germination protein [Paenibacillus glycanilyticus]MCM3627064.1 Ger(x)C family spore germination protein [Paenibacillus glycanilyticus]